MLKPLPLRGKSVTNFFDVSPVNELSYHILSGFGMHYRKNNVVLTFRLGYAADHV
jgi:hypothetical protein